MGHPSLLHAKDFQDLQDERKEEKLTSLHCDHTTITASVPYLMPYVNVRTVSCDNINTAYNPGQN